MFQREIIENHRALDPGAFTDAAESLAGSEGLLAPWPK